MQKSNDSMWSELLRSFEEQPDRASFLQCMQEFDQKLSENCEPDTTSSLNLSLQYEQARTLGIPKHNSLTDSMLRCTLGCEEKLAKSYLQILDQNDVSADQTRRVADAKARFIEANSYKDSEANIRLFKKDIRKLFEKPVVDNEHQAYLKTQLLFLDQPKGEHKSQLAKDQQKSQMGKGEQKTNKAPSKEYYDKQMDSVAKKISELGGMEDTVSRMEQSLSQNEVNNFKRRDILRTDSRKELNSPLKARMTDIPKESWLERSRDIRGKFAIKFKGA